ncbi:PucR family transcriptional regulator [Rhodococcus sp. NPDC058514]|uniref:PucR family transcriptional regulator n=1 Tax=unclassified Rhodococcus (in: high G+C Gram-positive bacteria) TaxID=192944 RepID=UPI00365856F9
MSSTNSPLSAGRWMREYVSSTFTREDFEGFIDRLDSSICSDVPELAADAELQRDLKAAIRSQFRVFLGAEIPVDGARVAVTVSGEAHALARTIARRGLDLRVLSQFDHACHRAVLGFATEFVAQQDLPNDFTMALMTMMWEQTSELMNTLLEELSATYTRERESLLRGAFSQRVGTVREILDGGPVDVAQASARMAYPLHRSHTAVAVWAEDTAPGVDPVADLEAVAARMARAVAATDLLCVPSGARGLWAWMVDGDRLGTDPQHAALVPAGIRIAVGDVGAGIDGFRRSHREAQAARSIAENGRQRRTLTRYRDVEVVSLVSPDPAARSALIERELRGMLGGDAASERLRDTVRAVLSCWGNHEAAARRLGVHKNTVRYRIQRVEAVLGRDLATNRLPLELALECFDTFGR